MPNSPRGRETRVEYAPSPAGVKRVLSLRSRLNGAQLACGSPQLQSTVWLKADPATRALNAHGVRADATRV